jgi:hypothetical protein
VRLKCGILPSTIFQKSGVIATRDETDTVTSTIITVQTTMAKLSHTIKILARKVMEITTNKKAVLKDIDDIDEMEEGIAKLRAINIYI